METVNGNRHDSGSGTPSMLTATLAAWVLGAALVGQTANAAESAASSGDALSADPRCEQTDPNDCLAPEESSTIGARVTDGNNEYMSTNAFDEAAPYDDLVEQGSRPVDDGLSTTLPTTSADNPGNRANGASDQ